MLLISNPSKKTCLPKPFHLLQKKKIDPKQFGEYTRERQQLKSIFDPLAEEAADKIHDLTGRHPSEVKELAQKFETVELPYGEAYVMMSPLLLGNRADMQPPADWEGSKMDWFDRLIDDFVERIDSDGTEYEKIRYKNLKERREWSDFNNRPPDDIPYNSYYFFTELKKCHLLLKNGRHIRMATSILNAKVESKNFMM